MRSYVAVLVLVVSAASAGCGSTPPRGGDDEPEDVLQGPDFGGFEVDTGTAGDTGGQQDVADAGQLDAVSDRTSDTTPSDVSEAEGARAMGLAWCLPEAVPYDLSGLPPLPVGFDPDTYCSATSVSPAGERAPTHRHVFDPETRTLTVTASELMGPGDSVVRYELDGAGRVRSMYRRGQEGWYSVGVGETWYAWLEIDEVEVGEIVDFCQERWPGWWREPVGEDLVEAILLMGGSVSSEVTLVVRELLEGKRLELEKVAMTGANRRAVLTYNRAAENGAVPPPPPLVKRVEREHATAVPTEYASLARVIDRNCA